MQPECFVLTIFNNLHAFLHKSKRSTTSTHSQHEIIFKRKFNEFLNFILSCRKLSFNELKTTSTKPPHSFNLIN